MGQPKQREPIEDNTPPPPVSRAARKRPVRAVTVNMNRYSKRDFESERTLYPEDLEAHRPTTRGGCSEIERPCPFVSCRHHLYLDVSPRTGAIKLNFPDLEPDELEVSCSLDVAAEDGATLDRVGDVMNLTRERVRQIEATALAKYREAAARHLFHGDRPPTRRRLPIATDHAFDVERFVGEELDEG